MGRTVSWVVVGVCATMMVTACFPDFDRFKNVPEPGRDAAIDEAEGDVEGEDTLDVPEDVSEDTAEPDTADAGEVDTDASEDVVSDVADEDVVEITTLGDACVEDRDCTEGEFCALAIDGGLCTVSCLVEEDCPDSMVCAAAAGFGYCLTRCEDVCERPALQCGTLGEVSTSVCISDPDGDGVLSSLDNCPDRANADQANQDGDDRGNVCDPLPACPEPAVETPLTAEARAAAPRPLLGGAWVPLLTSSQLLYIGGHDLDGAPIADVAAYSLVHDSWDTTAVPPFPYPADHVLAAYDRQAGDLVATSGSAEGFDSLVILERPDGQELAWRLGPNLPTKVYRGAIVVVSQDLYVISGYTQPDPAAVGFRWVTYLYDRSSRTVEGLGFPLLPDPAGDVVAIAQDGIAYLLNARDPENYFRVDPAGHTFTGAALGGVLFGGAAGADQAMVGFSGPSPLAYYANFVENAVRRVRVDTLQVDDTPYAFSPVTDDPNSAELEGLFLQDSMSYMVLVTEGDPLHTSLHQIYLGCADDSNPIFDDDGDGVSALSDNCPVAPNEDQSDIDADGLGDICDDDADGDGFDDATDPFVGDTDNDGLTNDVDLDDDGDRISDMLDPLPLDSDNDAVPNDIDTDDDGDGVSDLQETASGSNPVDRLSVPGSNTATFIKEQVDGGRQLFIATFADLADGVDLSPVDTSGRVPAHPRVRRASQQLIFSDITNPASPVLILQNLTDNTQQPATITGLQVESVDFWTTGLSALFVSHRTNWAVESMPLGAFGAVTATTVHTQTGPIHGLAVAERQAVALFSAGPDCAICLDIKHLDLSSGVVTPEPITELGISETHARPWETTEAIVFLAEPDGHSQAFVGVDGGPQKVTPDDWEVASADFAGSATRIVVSARPLGQPDAPYQLYLLDWTEPWAVQLTDGTESITEIAFDG